MASLPTGSDKLLEIRASDITMVIKSKKKQTANSAGAETRSSSLVITGYDIERIKIVGQEENSIKEPVKGYSSCSYSVYPLFFEQTDYEVVVNSNTGKSISFWNENSSVREKVSPIIDGNESLITGVVNFGNFCGYSDFEIRTEGIKVLTVRLEIYPTKISYREDYQKMVADVSEMVYAAAIDFMQKTYQEFSIGDKQNTVPAIFFQIITAIFDKYIKAAKHIVSVPHHKLITEHNVVPAYKSKRTDRSSERWLMKHSDCARVVNGKLEAERVLSVRKQITYDTTENRFVKFILQSTIRKLEDFEKRYLDSLAFSGKQAEDHVIKDAEGMIRQIRGVLNTSFLREISDYHAVQSMSLVFGMAPGYRELYKYYLMLHRGLSVNGDFFRISVKNTAQLYEYWCFIKLFSLLKKEYELNSPDIIKVDNTGVTVTLVQGKKSEAVFVNPRTGEHITLVYNPGESKTQTVNQRPDNVLELEKKGSKTSYKYVFDAKYRIEQNPSGNFYPDANPGPKVDDINTMHRYRDSIVYENKESRFVFQKTMFGAYILFPYDDEEKYSTAETMDNGKKVEGHRFYRSIDTVNIGGLPFLPGATSLVEKLLGDLISDSKESAFERTTLPSGIEEKLSRVDWDNRDVLIGTVQSQQELDKWLDKKYYDIPKKQIDEKKLPIHYVAMYQTKTKFGSNSGIRRYGEVLRTAIVKYKDAKESGTAGNSEDELFYRFVIREWKELSKPILPKEKGFKTEFTNMFLLEHSEYIPELQLEDAEQYRFYSELKRNVNSSIINEAGANIGFEHEDVIYSFVQGQILAMSDGKILDKVAIADFAKKPAQTFNRLRQYVGILQK